MTAWLLDGNLLCALAIDTHVHHALALQWFDARRRSFATCAVTEGTLLRVAMGQGATASAAWSLLREIGRLDGHAFWDDGFSYRDVRHRHIQGGRQVTDAWLAELCRRRGGKLATLDGGLATLHPDVADLIR